MPGLKILLSIFLFFAMQKFSFGCGNEYYSIMDAPYVRGKLDLKSLTSHNHDMLFPYWHHGFGENVYDGLISLARKIDPSSGRKSLKWSAILKALENNTDYKLLSDYAWYELRIGNKKNAVRLLENLYEKYPGEYNIVANLGTAYEVTGNNQKALELLKKAVAINPGSHYGSEWIHINILEQKVKTSPDYTAIIGLGSSSDYNEWLKGSLYKRSIPPDSLMTQIAYQLHERISFVAAPDPVVAQLILDFADLVSITSQNSEAKNFYNYAISYDKSLEEKVNSRLKTTEPAAVETASAAVAPSLKPNNQRPKNTWMIYVGLAIILVLITWLIIRRRNRVSSQ